MKRVFSSLNLVLVHHSRNLLEAEGIQTEMRNQMLSSAMGELPPAECQAELWVRDDAEANRAEQILRFGSNTDRGPAWRCAACGESCEAQFTQCWKCDSYRTG
jgi:uncharacterized ferredoxin-like protein